ncbi:DUF2079 domain-containing protein [Jatrophihabitans sp. YIM 134969]
MTPTLAVPARVPHHRRDRSAPSAVGLAVAVLWAALGLVRQHTLRTGIDLGLYTQAVQGYAHGHLPWSTLKTADGRFDLLGDHVTPVMALLAPAYREWPHPSTLIVAQAVAVGLAATVLARTAGRVFGSVPAGVLVGAAFGSSWGVAGLALFDVHEVAFGLPVLAVVVDRAVDDRWRDAVAWAVPLLLVKEDSAFLLAGLGLACWASGRRCLGASTVLGALAAWWVLVGVIVPRLSWSGRYTYWSVAGGGPLESLGRAAVTAVSSASVELLVVTALTSLGLVVRSPLVWVAVPPTLARLAAGPAYVVVGHHYDATLALVVVGGFVDAVHRGWWRQWRPRVTRLLPAALLVVSLAASLVTTLHPATDPSYYRCPRCASVRSALAVVPPGASVVADTYLVDQLVDRDRVYLLAPGLLDSVGRPVTATWVVADRRSGAWPSPAAVDRVLDVARSHGCVDVHDADDVVVLHCR